MRGLEVSTATRYCGRAGLGSIPSWSTTGGVRVTAPRMSPPARLESKHQSCSTTPPSLGCRRCLPSSVPSRPTTQRPGRHQPRAPRGSAMRLFRRPRPSPLASPRTAPLPEPPAQLPSVLVGVNGQAGTLDTVAWAAAEASTRRVGLHILHVARWPVIVDPYGAAQVESQIHDPAQRILDQALEQARQVGPELPVSTHLATGTPARAIAHAAEHAALIVLGRHHKRHRLPRRSVTPQVAARSHRPIAVARMWMNTSLPKRRRSRGWRVKDARTRRSASSCSSVHAPWSGTCIRFS